MHDSVILCFGHLSDTGSLRYTELPNIDIFHCTIEKSDYINITTYLIRKILKYWEAGKLMVVDTSSSRF